jgi:hypothetical protein
MLFYQGVTGFLPRLRERRVRLRPAFNGARLDTVRSVGIDHQRGQGVRWARRAEPPHGIDEAEPLQGHTLPPRRCQHDHADQVVDQGEDSQVLEDSYEALAVQHLQAHRLFEVPQKAEDGRHDEEGAAAVTPACTFGVSLWSCRFGPIPRQHLLGEALDGSSVVGEDRLSWTE